MSDKLIITDWGGVIEKASNLPWIRIGNIFGVDGIDLKHQYVMHQSLELIDNRPDFIASLDKAFGDIPMKIPENDRTYADIAGTRPSIEEYGKAEYLYTIYQLIAETVPYRGNIIELMASLSDQGIKTGLLTDIGVWDLKRQNRRLGDRYRDFSFIWQSCRTGKSKKSGTAWKRCLMDIENAGIKPEDVLYIDDNESYLRVAQRICGWSTLYDVDWADAEELKGEIDKFLEK